MTLNNIMMSQENKKIIVVSLCMLPLCDSSGNKGASPYFSFVWLDIQLFFKEKYLSAGLQLSRFLTNLARHLFRRFRMFKLLSNKQSPCARVTEY